MVLISVNILLRLLKRLTCVLSGVECTWQFVAIYWSDAERDCGCNYNNLKTNFVSRLQPIHWTLAWHIVWLMFYSVVSVDAE